MTSSVFSFALVFIIITARVLGFRLLQRPLLIRSSLLQASTSTEAMGKVVVTGVGQSEEDEFLLNLINEQESWSKITLLTDNIQEARKRFLTRSARYSGLLNDLEFSDVQFADPIRRKELLADSYAWLAFNVSEQEIVGFAAAGIAAGVKRAIFTTELPPERVNETSIPAFEAAVIAFHEVGGAFTGIRHGTVIAGSEDSAYEIVNATTPCVESTVPRGVLARVVTEALRTDSTHHAVYGVSSSGAFAGAYLNILRASGLSRQQEVEKIFKGGIQRVAQLVQKGKKREQDASEQKSVLLEDQIELSAEPANTLIHQASERPLGTSTVYDDHKLDVTQNEEQQSDRDQFRVQWRTQELLEDGFRLFTAAHPHLLTTVSKNDFWKLNEAIANEHAMAEVYGFREKVQLAQYKHQAKVLDKKLGVADEERRQYARLLALKHQRTFLYNQTQNSKPNADAWVRYLYLLLESTEALCRREGVALEALQSHEQTLLLRCQANALRAQGGLPSSHLLCDPHDAFEVVSRLTQDAETMRQYGLHQSTAEILTLLREKYSHILHTLPTLHQPAQILKDAISTLRGKATMTTFPATAGLSFLASAERYEDELTALSRGPVLVSAEQIQFTVPNSSA